MTLDFATRSHNRSLEFMVYHAHLMLYSVHNNNNVQKIAYLIKSMQIFFNEVFLEMFWYSVSNCHQLIEQFKYNLINLIRIIFFLKC